MVLNTPAGWNRVWQRCRKKKHQIDILTMKYRCPICDKVLAVNEEKPSEENTYFPFCSQRCKLTDLGAWLDAGYKIVSRLPRTPLNNTE
jgi:endogenous inhibitor of DNA gyrase (YacG/DUF329 family)